MFSLKKFFRSFSYAVNGLIKIFKEEHSFRVQILIGIAVLLLSFLFQIKVWELIVVILVISLILIFELINSVIERFADILKPRLHPFVENTKDMMAAVVLILSIAAALIGLLIFIPYFIDFFANLSQLVS